MNMFLFLSREQKLKFYALFKHASEGACNTARPGMLDFIGWIQAWEGMGAEMQCRQGPMVGIMT